MNNQAKAAVVNQDEQIQALQEQLKQLRAEKKQGRQPFEMKEFVDKKTGEVKVGIICTFIPTMRGPLFLYANQLQELLSKEGEAAEFLEAHRSQLTWKK